MTLLPILAFACLGLCGSCKEDVDESDLYTFTGEMMIDHFVNHPDTFGCYVTLLKRVHPSKQSPSTMYELLSARGNYTCFAPDNDAITSHVDSLFHAGVETTNDLTQISDSLAESIVFNSIIENGENNAYESTAFRDPLPRYNMNDRPIRVAYGTDEQGNTLIYINLHSKIIKKDIKVVNGMIHAIDHVISPSNATVAELIHDTDNLRFFSSLLSLTGWDSKMTDYIDEAYEDNELAGEIGASAEGRLGLYPLHRYFKYTAFVEKDSVYQANGITDLASLKQYLKTNAYYDTDTSYGDDYESEDNAVNQFVAYHILPVGLDWSNMVIFSNEFGSYNAQMNDGTRFNVNVWEYWETIGKHRRSMKITGLRGARKQINRYSYYNLVNYREIMSMCEDGVEVEQNNGRYENLALNGYYFPITDMLLWTEKVPHKILNERQRYNICALLPEFINANCRRHGSGVGDFDYWFFTPGYFENMPYVSNTSFLRYAANNKNNVGLGGTNQWLNYQADEWSISGVYDFIIKLPPVPYTGTYEIRYGISANGNRGMAQIYLGKNPENLPAIGIPLDLRILGSDPLINWKSDSSLGSDDAINELDKAMRLNGYMKAPKYFCPASGVPARDCRDCLRRIIFTGQLEAGQSYYVRFKSVLESSTTQFFFDYLELTPKTIYNGIVAEDKW